MANALYDEIDRLRTENMKWKSTVEGLEMALQLVERDRDYWREIAMRGGGGGN